MVNSAWSLLLLPVLVLSAPTDKVFEKRQYVDTSHPYTGPSIPSGDVADPSLTGNGTGFVRLYEAPAVSPPPGQKVTNNINVISLSYIPDGMNIHFQTAFGFGGEACVEWGGTGSLGNLTKGATMTYDRTPPCSLLDPTQCSQFFHNVQLQGLMPGTKYFYQIPGGNGTTPSPILSFTTAVAAGSPDPFSVAVINDMGYTNAQGTHDSIVAAITEGAAFAWHGGDIAYADSWFYSLFPCTPQPSNTSGPEVNVCYDGANSTLPGGVVDNPNYLIPLPAGEFANTGGPNGGDVSTMYETSWDIWQQWQNEITMQVPYMVTGGNHDISCDDGHDGPNNQLTAYLNGQPAGSTAPNSTLNYYSCPESQRNFTSYLHRFRMPGAETGGRSNMWYSFDYGLAHFVSFDTETDFYKSAELPFLSDLTGNETFPMENETIIDNAGPFGNINGSFKVNANYEQVQWLQQDLASVDRSKTPWVFAMAHRPLYSSNPSGYMTNNRNAFEKIMIDGGVDAYFCGHIHWYERMWPLGLNQTIDQSAIVNNHTYKLNTGNSIAYITNGQAGNIESHGEPGKSDNDSITAYLNYEVYGMSKLTVENATYAKWEFIHGGDGEVLDYVWFTKG